MSMIADDAADNNDMAESEAKAEDDNEENTGSASFGGDHLQQQQSICGNDNILIEEDDEDEDESLDTVQALNAALCFLCWINADSNFVIRYLKKNPEALLLEGTIPDEGARCIVEEHICRCKCTKRTCNNNRQRLLDILDCGFEYFQALHMMKDMQYVPTTTTNNTTGGNTAAAVHNGYEVASSSCPCEEGHQNDRENGQRNSSSLLSSSGTVSSGTASFWNDTYSSQLLTLARDLRILQMEEIALRNKVLEMNIEKTTFQRELDKVTGVGTAGGSASRGGGGGGAISVRRRRRRSAASPGPLSFLLCTRNSDNFAHRSILEYQVGLAELKLSSVKKEHKYLQQSIRQARRTQYALLKIMFAGCPRHICTANERKRPI